MPFPDALGPLRASDRDSGREGRGFSSDLRRGPVTTVFVETLRLPSCCARAERAERPAQARWEGRSLLDRPRKPGQGTGPAHREELRAAGRGRCGETVAAPERPPFLLGVWFRSLAARLRAGPDALLPTPEANSLEPVLVP